MTMGGFDNVAVVDAPDDESLAKYVLTLGSEGNLRTVTLNAFPEETYRTFIGALRRLRSARTVVDLTLRELLRAYESTP